MLDIEQSSLRFNTLQNSKVFITGHTGFKGAWLTLLLEKLGVNVVGYSLQPEEHSLYNLLGRRGLIQEYFSDLRDYASLYAAINEVKPTYIIHLAAQSLVLESYKNPIKTFETNVMGTANLLEACRFVDSIQKISVVTTDKVYENHGSGRAFVEGDPLGANDPYSASKVATEAVVRAWRTILKEEKNFELFSLRAGNVIGGGDYSPNRLLPDIVRAAQQKNKLVIRYPQSTRPWQHVLDPLLGYISVFNQAKFSEYSNVEAFNFGPDEKSMSVQKVLDIAQKVYDGKLLIETDSITTHSYEADLLDLNSAQAKSLLGWSPIWTQEESIYKTLEWWNKVSTKRLSPIEACEEDIEAALGEKIPNQK